MVISSFLSILIIYACKGCKKSADNTVDTTPTKQKVEHQRLISLQSEDAVSVRTNNSRLEQLSKILLNSNIDQDNKVILDIENLLSLQSNNEQMTEL